MSLKTFLDQKFYPQFDRNWDDQLFRERVLAVMRPSDVVLDLGAGSGRLPQMDFRGECQSIVGLDPDASVLQNPHLVDAKVGTGEAIPWPDQSFDLVIADNVLEHLSNPVRVFSEVGRVLKPGGRFLAKTPNRFHYVPMIALVTPTWFHKRVNVLRGRAESDTFPTFYRANDEGALRRIARDSGLELQNLERIEGRPEYLRISAVSYPLGILWERIVNASQALAFLRVILIGQFRRAD
jgi:SAM-dependent methyltransferase